MNCSYVCFIFFYNFRSIMANSEEYDFFKYLLYQETRSNHLYRHDQSISDERRAGVIDWLISLCCSFRSHNSVIHLSVQILDRFLSSNIMMSQNLQVAGAACFLIASKHDEVHSPKPADLLYSMGGTTSVKELVDMESFVLQTIGFQLSIPTANIFLCNLVNLLSIDISNNSFNLSSFYIELSLLTTTYLQFSSCLLAASALVLSRILLKIPDPWPNHIAQVTSLDLSTMQECILFLSSLVSAAKDYPYTKEVIDKYSYRKYNFIAKLKQPDNLPR